MGGLLFYVSLVECLTMFCFLTFVESADVINGAAFQTRLVEKHGISAVDVLKSDRGYNVFQKKQSGNSLRKTHRLPDTLFHGRKHTENLRHKKENDSASDENKPEFNKRDFFFAPASPYGQMMNPVARRMFLVHRGERGPCFFHVCHHGGMCVPRRHGFYCECLPGFMGTRCEVKTECRSTTCKNGGTCTEIAIGRHLCTCPVGFLGDNCEERSFCHPNPCLNGGTCSQSDESYTCVCEDGYKGKNCEAINKCSPNPCKNAGVCFELNNDFVCNCPQGFKGKTCEIISECSSVYCLNGGICRDEPNGYRCDCRFGFYGKRCQVQTRLLWKKV